MALPKIPAGHGALRQRVEDGIARCQEEPGIDFKQSAPWVDLRAKLVRHCLAMANLVDGGLIVLGVREDGTNWKIEGMQQSHLETYDPDTILDEVKKYASSPLKIAVVVHEDEHGRAFVVLHVHPVEELPVVCTRNGGGGLVAGGFFVRPAEGRPRSERVMCAEDMRYLVHTAAERIARQLIEQSRRIGALEAAPTTKSDEEKSQDGFDAELGGL